MDRYVDIKEKIINLAKKDTSIKGIISIGSSTRSDVVADEYSDLDLIIVTAKPECWFCGDYPSQLGNVSISFMETTIAKGKEIRTIYDEDRDVDMIILTEEQFLSNITSGVLNTVMNRGYKVLYDSMDYSTLLEKNIKSFASNPNISEDEYNNMVNDFYFHIIWCAKKYLRKELWAAKMCVDAYLKNYLLKMIEIYSYNIDQVDTWHAGRFIDTWANVSIKESLSRCFGRYNLEDIRVAILETYMLFSRLDKAVASYMKYTPQTKARICAMEFIEEWLVLW